MATEQEIQNFINEYFSDDLGTGAVTAALENTVLNMINDNKANKGDSLEVTSLNLTNSMFTDDPIPYYDIAHNKGRHLLGCTMYDAAGKIVQSLNGNWYLESVGVGLNTHRLRITFDFTGTWVFMYA